jgi:hypothetical protein
MKCGGRKYIFLHFSFFSRGREGGGLVDIHIVELCVVHVILLVFNLIPHAKHEETKTYTVEPSFS